MTEKERMLAGKIYCPFKVGDNTWDNTWEKSREVLVKARKNISQAMFIRRDCSRPLSDLGKFDLIFSNAFIQCSVHVQTPLPDR